MNNLVIKDDNFVVGIVGGMGSYATVDFFRRVVDAFPAEKEWDRPRIIIDNYCTMPSRVRAVLYNEKRDELVSQLTSAVAGMLNAGADKLVFACNTSHIFIPEVINKLPECGSKIINIIEECANEVVKAGCKSVGLIATEGTIETGIYEKIFGKYNIRVNSPERGEFSKLRNFIEAVKQNNIQDEIMRDFVVFVDDFNEDAVVLGCTEIPILYNECMKHGYGFLNEVFDPLEAAIAVLIEEKDKYSK